MINWQYFPKSDKIPIHLQKVVTIFENEQESIDSELYQFNSDKVLSFLRNWLERNNFKVEKSKKKLDKINVPVLFGKNGKLEKFFEADWLNIKTKTVIEVEAWRAVSNYQFLKDLFQASVMHDVEYLVIAVRNVYRWNNDFEKVISFIDTLYSSNKLILPLSWILIIWY